MSPPSAGLMLNRFILQLNPELPRANKRTHNTAQIPRQQADFAVSAKLHGSGAQRQDETSVSLPIGSLQALRLLAAHFAMAAMRRFISSGETSSRWTATVHLCPQGSSMVPVRSP